MAVLKGGRHVINGFLEKLVLEFVKVDGEHSLRMILIWFVAY